MGREIKRVTAGFDWPLNKTWEGYLTPEWLHFAPCPDCKNGYSREGEHFHNEWYGYVQFDPTSTGSTPLTADSPAVRAFAERQIQRTPEYYGTGEDAIRREGERLAKMWNEQWSHHLSQLDVDALVEGNRLWDFTRDYVPGEGWKEKAEPYTPTAAEVNAWSIGGFGHDGINSGVVIKARCEREGVPYVCATCKGRASVDKFKGQRKVAKKWKAIEPPKGDWWQIWETVSEGSPVTPAFATPGELAEHFSAGDPSKYTGALEWITGEGWAPSMIAVGGVLKTSDDMIASGSVA